MNLTHVMRHGQLAEPYHDYSLLDLNELGRLSMVEVDPDIDVEANMAILDSRRAEFTANYQVIYASPAKRAQQSAALLKQFLNLDAEIVVVDALAEITFDPRVLVSEADYAAKGMPAVREALYQSLLQGGSGSESLESVFARISQVQELLASAGNVGADSVTDVVADAAAGTCVCVSHGFFIRFLEMVLSGKAQNVADVNMDLIYSMPNYTNLAGFDFRG